MKKVPLKAVMIAHASALMGNVTPDMVDTEILQPFEHLIPDSGLLDAFNAQKIAVQVMEAMSVSKLYSKVCKAFFLAGRKEVQRQEALKFFEADEELKKGELKVTDSLKKAYVDKHEDVLKAKDVRNSWECLMDYFETSMYGFRDQLTWLRSIVKEDLGTGDMREEA